MIDVDISRVWGVFSLPDLLGIERGLFDAHNALAQACPGILSMPSVPMDEILRASEKIQRQSQVVVMVGDPSCTLGVQAVLDLLQGPDRNRTNPCLEIYYTGSTYSSRHFQELDALLEGRDFSVIVVSDGREEPRIAYALWHLCRMLENKYGSLGQKDRVYAVTGSGEGWLREMISREGWNCLPGEGENSILNAKCLLPLAAAGVDIREMIAGAALGMRDWNLRSFENPLWLYTGVRRVMGIRGKKAEILAGLEPGLGTFGAWYRHQFAAGTDDIGICVLPMEYPRDLSCAPLCRGAFETMIRFAPAEKADALPEELSPDFLKEFAGLSPDELQNHLYESTLESHEDMGFGILTVECGPLNCENLGQLLCFMSMSSGLYARLSCPEETNSKESPYNR